MPSTAPTPGGARPGTSAGRPTSRAAGPVAGLLAVLALLGLAAAAVLTLQPPAPAPANAPATAFSATRAMATVQAIATQPHVVGSAADGQVTDRLAADLRALGLQVTVRAGVGAWPGGPARTDTAAVRNVVAVLPGTASTGRLFLMAHHDSVQNGPGASDDSAGVAAVLETARALAAGPRLRDDVVLVLTDGEEACLCGAQAFLASDPLAADGGVVLNLEARGTSGPPIMFETSRGNAALAARYADAVPHPVATSFAVEVYRALPNDTDLSPVLAAGLTGLNTAWVDGAAAYHTSGDTPAALDRGSLQAMGDNTLALTRDLAGRDLRPLAKPAADDATYFPVLGRLVIWSGRLVWPVAAVALAAVALLVVVLRRRGVCSLGRTAAGTALAVLPLALGPLAAYGLRLALVAVRPAYAAVLDPWRPGWYRVAVVAVVLAVVLGWYALLRRRVGAAALTTGALVWLAGLGAALAALAPGGSYLAALPALAGALTAVVAVLLPRWPVVLAAGLLGGAVAVLVLAPAIALFLPALGLRTVVAPAVVVTLLALALLPAAEQVFPARDAPPRRWASALVPLTVLVAAVAPAATGLAVDRFDAAHPVPSQLVYALDADTGHAWWASTEQRPGAFTSRYVHGRTPLPVAFPLLAGQDLATGPAYPAQLLPPALGSVQDRVVGDRRELSLRVVPRRPDRLLVVDLEVPGGKVTAARVAGTPAAASSLGAGHLELVVDAPSRDGVEVLVTVQGGAAPSLRLSDGSDGLDGLPGYTPRPPGVAAAGTHTSDLVLVTGTVPLP